MVAHERLTGSRVTMRWLLAKPRSYSKLPAFLHLYGNIFYDQKLLLFFVLYFLTCRSTRMKWTKSPFPPFPFWISGVLKYSFSFILKIVTSKVSLCKQSIPQFMILAISMLYNQFRTLENANIWPLKFYVTRDITRLSIFGTSDVIVLSRKVIFT